MKKVIVFGAVMCVLCGLVLAAGPNGKGAVRMDLNARQPGDAYNEAGSGPLSGFVIANTTASGKLIINIQLKEGEPEADYTAYVKVNGPSVDYEEPMTTNVQGKGSLQVELDVSEETITVQVVVKNSTSGFATAHTGVPVK